MDDDMATKMNGAALPSSVVNGSPIPPTKKRLTRRRRKSNLFVTLVSSLLRLALWGTVLTVIFTCPSTADDLTDDSSRLCQSYVDLRSKVAPHLEPSYRRYIKPYIDRAQPHIDQFNSQVYLPTAGFVTQHYDTYAAPRVALAQHYVLEGWADTVQPKLEEGRLWVLSEYEQKLSPHVSKALEASDPYLQRAQSELVEIYDTTLVPLYDKSLPYAQQIYSQGHHVATQVVLPYIQTAHDSTSAFLSRHIWPQLVILYGENVEPQLMRITERLGRYKDSRKLEKAFINKSDISASIISAASSASSAASASLSSEASEVDGTPTKAPLDEETIAPSEIPSELDVREKIESDLKTWQEKFAKAADTGAEDLGERVQEITSKQIESQAHGVGSALITQLDNTVQSSIKDLKEHINTSISKIPIDADESDEDLVYAELLKYIKSTGEKIRKRAVAVRNWKQKYDNETDSLVQAALESTLDVIDNIRDLGLQEIGMRWAWMEGVTYKDWSKYHALKKTFDTWRDQVAKAAHDHEGLVKAKEEGEAVQEEGMKMAEAAATELMRLKEVARWKVLARDSTDDFSSKVIPARAVKAARSIASVGSESIKDAISSASSVVLSSPSPSSGVDYLEALKENVDEAISTVKSAASVASEKFSHASESEDSIVSSASSTASSVASEASEVLAEELSMGQSKETSEPVKVWGGAAAAFVEAKQVVLDDDFSDSWSEQISSLLEAAGDKASELTSAVSAALIKPTSTQGTVESVTSLAQEQYVKALSAASSVLFGTPQPMTESLASVFSDQYAQAVTAASYAIYGTPTPVLESLASQATAVYGNAASQVQEALAMVTSVASSRLADSLSLVSAQYTSAKVAVGAQPPAVHQQFLSEAQRRYYEGIGMAHDQYSRFVDAVSTAIHGNPTPWYESLASEASKTIIGTPTPAYESLFSAAQSQYDMIMLQASQKLNLVRFTASDILKTTGDPAVEKLLRRASEMYSSATSIASESFASATSSASIAIYGSSPGAVESIVSAASEGIVGTEPSWNEAMASKASENYNSLIAKASEQIYGTPTPFAQSIWNDAGEYAAQVTGAAASQYSVIQAIVSELVIGKEPDFTESVMSRLSSAYYTGAGAVVASASSLASEAYDSASSVIASVFTPPPALESIIDDASKQFQAAVDYASEQVYGSQPPGYLEAAQSSVAALASNAQRGVSEAIYGTSTGYVEAAASSAASVYSVAGEAVSKAVYGVGWEEQEKGAWESASSRVAAAAESASARIAELIEGVKERVRDEL